VIIFDISLEEVTVIAKDVVLNRWYAETSRKLYSILSENDIAMNLYRKVHEIQKKYDFEKTTILYTSSSMLSGL